MIIQRTLRILFLILFCFLIVALGSKNLQFLNQTDFIGELKCEIYPSDVLNKQEYSGYNSKIFKEEISVYPEFKNVLCINKVKKIEINEKAKLINIYVYDSTRFKTTNNLIVLFSLFLAIIYGSLSKSNLKVSIIGVINLLIYSYLFSSFRNFNELFELFLIYVLSVYLFFNSKSLKIENIKRVQFNDQINILRAISVSAVILYHFKLFQITGGWLGVDIFFVLSGYLISNSILSKINDRTFSFKSFYLRRLKRLTPALFFVILISLLPAYVLLAPNITEIYLYGIISSIFFFSNFYYLNLDSYTSPEADYYPFLHTWSLSIEEQFYIILPIIFVISYKYFKKNLVIFLNIVFLISIFVNYLPFTNKQLFYLPYLRFWEFTFGILIMFVGFNNKSIKNKTLYIAALIVGFYFLIFTLESDISSLIVLLNDSSHNFFVKLNKVNFVKHIGLSSYSSYLLHQPIYSFYLTIKDKNFSQHYSYEKIILIALIFIFSYYMWKNLEIYFLKIENNNKFVFLFFIALLVIFSYVLIGLQSNNFSSRYEELPLKVTNLIKDEGEILLRDENGKICDGFNNYCEFNISSDKKMIVIGDSQSILFSSFLYQEYKNEFNFIPLNGDRLFRCVFYEIDLVGDCEGNEENLFNEFILKNPESTYVFLASFERFEEGWTKAGQNFSFYFNKISNLNNDLIVISPVPYSFKNIDIKLLYENRNFKFGDTIGYDFEEWNPKISQINKFLNVQDVSIIIDPTEAFCENIIPNTCVSASGDKIYYYDRVHLSLDGQKVLTDYFLKIINENVNLLNHYR